MAAKKKAPPKPRGRPSTYSKDTADEIIERLASGEPLAQICRDEKMPALRTVYDWVDADNDADGKKTGFSARFARAREDGEDMIAVDCLDIADNQVDEPLIDPSTGVPVMKDGQIIKTKSNVSVQHAKLRIETRLKLLAKWNPKKYGEKVQQEVTGKDGGPIQTTVTKVERVIVRPADSDS